MRSLLLLAALAAVTLVAAGIAIGLLRHDHRMALLVGGTCLIYDGALTATFVGGRPRRWRAA